MRPPAAWWETRRQMVQGRVVGELAHLARKLRNSLGYGFGRHSLSCLGYRSCGCRRLTTQRMLLQARSRFGWNHE